MLEEDEKKKREDLNALQCTLKKIKNKPRYYIGIPLSCYYFVNFILEETNIPTVTAYFTMSKKNYFPVWCRVRIALPPFFAWVP